MTRAQARALLAEEVVAFGTARRAGDRLAAWRALERAHIVSQPHLELHLASHWAMLCYAMRERDLGEVVGQCPRLALAPFGAVFGGLPVGNTGRSNVSAFQPMPIPHDLLDKMNDKS